MSAAPDRRPWESNNVKRRKLHLGSGVIAAEFTQMDISNEERGERTKPASRSNSFDAPPMETDNFVIKGGTCASHKSPLKPMVDVATKRNLRSRAPLKNSVTKVDKAFSNGEREWSTDEKEKILSILQNEGFDGDMNKLAEQLPNQSNDSVRYLINDYEKERQKHKWEVMLDSKIEQLRWMEGAAFTENLPLCFDLISLFGIHPDSSLVGGIDYSAIYAYIASLMRGEVPKQLNYVTRTKLTQLFNQFKKRILAGPKVPMPEFKIKAASAIERKKELKERRSKIWSDEELEAKEILVSGNFDQIEQFYLTHASMNPF